MHAFQAPYRRPNGACDACTGNVRHACILQFYTPDTTSGMHLQIRKTTHSDHRRRLQNAPPDACVFDTSGPSRALRDGGSRWFPASRTTGASGGPARTDGAPPGQHVPTPPAGGRQAWHQDCPARAPETPLLTQHGLPRAGFHLGEIRVTSRPHWAPNSVREGRYEMGKRRRGIPLEPYFPRILEQSCCNV